ncbi:MAG: M20/M25/M40 family metallo-hydrolase [Gammaproteobacteria bacterium]|nr:M20/M25/M40 family metallo-hydrolase [Gammaproteobacteria bacterium]
MDHAKIKNFVSRFTDESVIPTLAEFIKIPALAPAFDANWKKNRNLDKALQLIGDWIKKQRIPGVVIQKLSAPGKTPLLYVDIPGSIKKTVMSYGHVDKMPGGSNWSTGLGPWKPVIRGDKLFGRGGVDDGYAALSVITAIKALAAQNIPYPRNVILLESNEEPGGHDFEYYLKKLQRKIGKVDLILCIDSGGNDYENLWSTSSLRGSIIATLGIEFLKGGVHSGEAGGAVPSVFRIACELLSRIEDVHTGKVSLPQTKTAIPKSEIANAKLLAKVLGKKIYTTYPFLKGSEPTTKNLSDLILNLNWRPVLTVIGIEGLPKIADAGNVLNPCLKLQLNVRLSPHAKSEQAFKALKKTFEAKPPYGAKITFKKVGTIDGWSADSIPPRVLQLLSDAAKIYFAKKFIAKGIGASIGTVTELLKIYPKANMLITGVSSPACNAHTADEFVSISAIKKFTGALCYILANY